MRCCVIACVLLHLLAASVPSASAAAAMDETIFRSGDELIVRIKDLDLLRQAHRQVTATIRLTGESGEKIFSVDLADPVTPESIVIDVAGYGALAGASLEIKTANGRTVLSRHLSPVPVVAMSSDLPLRTGQFAAIERGTAMGQASPPRIALSDAERLRQETLVTPQRLVTAAQITYPVVTDTDLPVLASANYVLVSRQSVAPDDPTRCSLYFSYRKAVYDAASARLKGWRKFLVEVPLQRAWLEGAGDQVLTLSLDGFAVHATEERAPKGANMLGESEGGLAQGGQSADTDGKGRIYFTNLSGGAGLARFNPHTRKFEQPPVDFDAEIRKLIPAEGDWRRGWDTALGQILCDRGRVFILFARNYRVHTPNGNFEACSGMISLPQEGWDDAAAFRADIRLHAGSWAGAKHRLYDSDVPVGVYTRKMAAPMATTHGIAFASASGCEGGPWRLDLDENGNTMLLARIKSTKDIVAADGTPLRPAEILTIDGLRKQETINVGSAGRKLIQFNYGEFEITRAALALTLPGAPRDHLVDASGRYRMTYEGAPAGTLTIRFDIASKLKADSVRYGELASSLSGMSLGPNYCVTPIPGEPDQAIGVCEYGYHLSRLDFSRRASDRKVFKTYLPFASGGQTTNLPAGVGLGPYNAAWADHDGATWLYLTGYTGMTRLRYAVGERPLEAFAADMFHMRLAPQASDGRPRDNVKDYLHIVPAIDGRMIDIGRGRPGRGGGAYSAGLELFDPRTLGKSQTLVHMNRCFNLYTPASRLVLSAAGAPTRQEIYAASGTIRQEYVLDIADPAVLPANRGSKVFVYDCRSGGGLRDLYGFSLPESPGRADNSGQIAFSPCRQFLVIMQGDGCIYSYSVAQRRFIDGLRTRNAAGEPVQPLEFVRPSDHLWAAPTGQLFFLVALEGPKSQSASFFEVTASTEGRLAVRPHLAVTCGPTARVDGFRGIVRCFLPDLSKKDGSYDFVLAGDRENGQATVRVIEDFVLPRPATGARALP